MTGKSGDKYGINSLDKLHMPQPIETENDLADTAWEDNFRRSENRQLISSDLQEIAFEVTAALRDSGVHIPVFFTVPISGDSLLTFATALDPSDDDWDRAIEIISKIVAKRIDVPALVSRKLTCVAAGVPMGAADVMALPGTQTS